jgi:hypothetical protein
MIKRPVLKKGKQNQMRNKLFTSKPKTHFTELFPLHAVFLFGTKYLFHCIQNSEITVEHGQPNEPKVLWLMIFF